MKHSKFFLAFVAFILLTLFLNGKISIPGVPLPKLGHFLNPHSGIWNNGEKAIFSDEQIKFPNLKGKAEVIFDERMVPHIYAENMNDALFIQGYIEAEQRLFQMDFMTRAASGRLSEVLGEITLPFDKKTLRNQLDLAADNAVKSWEKTPEFNLIQSYVDGVNAYISKLHPKDYPYEYKLLDFKPEPWTMKKTALVYKSMADVLAGGSYDLELSNSLAVLGRTLFNKLYPENEDGKYPVIPYENKYNFKNSVNIPKDSIVTGPFYKMFYENRKHGVGSNNWTVSAAKTKDKAPILCNDPHLGLSLPSIWIEEHIITPETNSYGVSFPGFPGIMIGFNDYIAWGETNVGQDIEDLFVVKWANNERTKYILDGKEVPVKIEVREIKVKGKQPVKDTLKFIDKGIIKLESHDHKNDIAVRWLSVDQQNESEYMTFIDIMQAKDYATFKKGLYRFNTPAQNFLFASKSGDIALNVNGKFPLRQNEDGRFVEDGSISSSDWDQYIPREQNPSILNPKQGYLASANQRSAGSDYPYYYTGKFEHFRNRVINDSLSKKNSITIDDMKKLQANSFNLVAYESLPAIIKILESNSTSLPILTSLKSWNCKYEAESKEATIFEILFENIYKNTFEEILQYSDKMDVYMPETWVLVHMIKNDQKSEIWDDVTTKDKKESMADIINKSWLELNKEKNKENLSKPWSAYRPVNIYHYTRVPAFSALNIVTDGIPEAINAMQSTFGPSWRMIVNLKAETEAYGVFPGGQSGNPLSRFYKNNVEVWAKNEYYKLNPSKEKAKHKSIRKIIIN